MMTGHEDAARTALIYILLRWERGQPKAVPLRALREAIGIQPSRLHEALGALAEGGLAKCERNGHDHYYRITGQGADWLFSHCVGVGPWKEWPDISPAVRERIATIIGEHYSGSQITRFLAHCGLANCGWRNAGTKWRELDAIFAEWQGAARMLFFHVTTCFLQRTNLVAIDEAERDALIKEVNKALAAHRIAADREGRLARLTEASSRAIAFAPELAAAARDYRWHENEIDAIAETLTDHSGCRSRAEVQTWLKRAGIETPRLQSERETLFDYWRRSLDRARERMGSEGVLPFLALLSDPREHLRQGNADHVHAALEQALEWSPVTLRAGRLAARHQLPAHDGDDLAEDPATSVRGVVVSEAALSAFLDGASEDDATTQLIAPLLRASGFVDVAPKGHRDKSGEYGQDIREMKLVLPTGHALFFAVQVKAGNISARASSGASNIATVLAQVQMALAKRTWDNATQAAVAVNHVLLVATGTISEDARSYLLEQLAEANRRVLFVDRLRLIDMAARFGLPADHATAILPKRASRPK